mgnify:CR=1 FL=1
MKKFFLKFFIILIILCEIIFYPIKLNAFGLVNINDNLSDCKLITNCNFQTWKVDDSEKAFIELIEILDNTPRLEIINKEKNYIHAIATSRIMKFIDDIEIKNLNQDNIFQIKSSSRLGFYDLGVNKRRLETLHFRLIDIYD